MWSSLPDMLQFAAEPWSYLLHLLLMGAGILLILCVGRSNVSPEKQTADGFLAAIVIAACTFLISEQLPPFWSFRGANYLGGMAAENDPAQVKRLFEQGIFRFVLYDNTLRSASAKSMLAFNVQSIQAFVAQFAFDSSTLKPWGPQSVPQSARFVGSTVAALLAAAVLLFAAVRARRTTGSAGDPIARVGVVLGAACRASPLVWSQYYTCLLVPKAQGLAPMTGFVAGDGIRLHRVVRTAKLAAAPMIILDFHDQWYTHLGVSHLVIGSFILLLIMIRESPLKEER